MNITGKSGISRNMADIAIRWDANVSARAAELASNDDPAYRSLTNHIARTIRSEVPAPANVIDAGCGLGYVSGHLSQLGYSLTGVDVSPRSIEYAQQHFPAVSFVNSSLEGYAPLTSKYYDAAVANMFLHNTPGLEAALEALASVLRIGGFLIVTIPHPAFYLYSRPELAGRNLNYSDEFEVQLPFRIRHRDAHPVLVSYYHRPVSVYLRAFKLAGFDVSMDEPAHVGPGKPHDIAVFAGRRIR